MTFDLSQMVPVAVIAAVSLMLLIRGRGMQRQAAQIKSESETRARFTARASDLAAASDVTAEILRSQVEFHEFARELQARLDNKVSALQALILEADRRIGHLERLRSDAGYGEGGLGSPTRPHYLPLEGAENPELSPAVTSRYVAIYALADAGHGPASIAARLGEPIGEVEMVLTLRKRVPSAN